ncbi:MAG: hypothetical protein PHX05_07100 [Acidobacteriota bacterium]|nr:hypothetical protein [Acidobacteriota bacterium]
MLRATNSSIRRVWQLLFNFKKNDGLPLLFLLLIFLPLANQVFQFVQPYPLDEKRRLAEKPVFDSRHPFAYAQSYEDYYNDHFTFRTRLVYWNSLLTYKVFRASARDNVVIGKKDWLFLGNVNPYTDEIDYYRNLRPFTMDELQYWRVLLEQRRNWLKRRGIHYIFTIAPNKSTIYPEFMPKAVVKIASRSRQDQLIDYLKKNSTLTVLDLRPALLAAKKDKLVYHKTDSHWNDLGGYVAYSEIIKNLGRYYGVVQPRPFDRYQITKTGPVSGDLSSLLSLPDIFWENQWQLESKTPLQARVLPADYPEQRNRFVTISVHTCASGALPAALMVHDSFAHQMKQFLSEDFSKIVYVWDWSLGFYEKIIKKENIKIVIDEMVEYSLLARFPSNPRKLRR